MAGPNSDDVSADLADLGVEVAFTCGTAWAPPQHIIDAAKEAGGRLDLVLLDAWRTFGPAVWRRVRTSPPDLADLGGPVAAMCSCPTVCTCGTVIRLRMNTATPQPSEIASDVVDFVRAWMVLVPMRRVRTRG